MYRLKWEAPNLVYGFNMKLLINSYFAFISLLIVAIYTITAVYFPQLYIICTYEDMYGEWGQAYFFLLTFIFAGLNVITPDTGRFRLFFALLALVGLYTFMEEISWGQRLIGFNTPDFFAEHSYQDEANLHNLLTGPVESWTKTSLTYVISLGMLVYGVLFPLLLKAQWRLALWADQWGCPAPPLGLMPAFLFAAIFEAEFFSFNEAEVAELLVAMGMSFTSLHFWLSKHTQWQSKRLAIFCAITLVVIAAAFSTTQILIHNPAQQEEINHRLANGYKKFADRYDRYDHYQAVVEVLQLYNQLKPDNTVILRRIRENYLLLGDEVQAALVLEDAIQIALTRHQADPENIPALISLAKSYHQVQRPEQVYLYAQKAYDLALQRALDNAGVAEQAYSYYWLAKACEQLNKQPEALKYYRQAHKLALNNGRYERAYYNKRHLMEQYYAEDWTESLYTD